MTKTFEVRWYDITLGSPRWDQGDLIGTYAALSRRGAIRAALEDQFPGDAFVQHEVRPNFGAYVANSA